MYTNVDENKMSLYVYYFPFPRYALSHVKKNNQHDHKTNCSCPITLLPTYTRFSSTYSICFNKSILTCYEENMFNCQ